VLDRIRKTLVGLKMPRALEVLDQTVRQLALEVIDTLFAEELTLRENRRVKMALRMTKLSRQDRSQNRPVLHRPSEPGAPVTPDMSPASVTHAYGKIGEYLGCVSLSDRADANLNQIHACQLGAGVLAHLCI
jgi:hypothetical protein